MVATRNIVVTAADEKYAALALDLVQSLEPFRGKLEISIACLDLGLEHPTLAKLAQAGVDVRRPEWQFRPHPKFSADRVYLARAARPFIRDIFPGHAVYVWIDADAWVQHPVGLNWLIQASRWTDIAAAPTVHRSYACSPSDIEWLWRRYTMGFGEVVAKKLMQQIYFNSGVYALPADSTVWKLYIERFQEALDRWEGDFLSDQAVLNAVVQLDGPKFERLPATVNWICHLARPRWNNASGFLVEPAMPFEPISIVHNTFNDKSMAIDIAALDGSVVNTKMTFTDVQQLRARTAMPRRSAT